MDCFGSLSYSEVQSDSLAYYTTQANSKGSVCFNGVILVIPCVFYGRTESRDHYCKCDFTNRNIAVSRTVNRQYSTDFTNLLGQLLFILLGCKGTKEYKSSWRESY